jgi:hypothetical protein
MPRGIHQRVRPVLERGAWVAVCLEGDAAELARERRCVIDGSCPSGLTPVFKRVVGIPEDRIRVAMDGVAVNGAAVRNSELKEVDSPGLQRAHGGGRDRPHGGPLLRDGNEPVAELRQPPFRPGLRASSRRRSEVLVDILGRREG